MAKKDPKLPPYIQLSLIEMRCGKTSGIESSILIISNNLKRFACVPKAKESRAWYNSMMMYWEWVLDVVVDHIKKSKTIDNDDRQILLNMINQRFPEYDN
jgi:hypothetical protein